MWKADLQDIKTFPTDKENQDWWKWFKAKYKLEPGFSYSINVRTGVIIKGKKQKIEAEKISKSNQPT